MNLHNKIGLLFMGIWIMFIAVLFGSYLLITNQSFSCFIDEETGGLISASFFVAWALIWFGIGRHYSIDYTSKRTSFLEKYKQFDEVIVCKAFKKAYYANIAHILSIVFFVSVPFYVAANVKDTVTVKNFLYVGGLMILSVIFFVFYKKNNIREITF